MEGGAFSCRKNLSARILLKHHSMDLLSQKFNEINFCIEGIINFLHSAQNHHFLNKCSNAVTHCGSSVATSGNIQATRLPPVIDTHQMAAHVATTKRGLPPFGLNEVNVPIEFNHAINLLSSRFVIMLPPNKVFPNKDFVIPAEFIQNFFKELCPLIRIFFSKQLSQFILTLPNRFSLQICCINGIPIHSPSLCCFAISFLCHAREGIFLANDFPDFSNQSSGLVLFLRPAPGKVLKFTDLPDDFALSPKHRLPTLVKSFNHPFRNLAFVDRIAIRLDLNNQISHQVVRDATSPEKHNHIVLAPADRRDRLAERHEDLGGDMPTLASARPINTKRNHAQHRSTRRGGRFNHIRD